MKKEWFTGLVFVLLILAAGFMGCQGTAPTSKLDADVVVVGGGLAGMSAAVEAARNGASVILVEKQSAIGGASAQSGGGMGAAGTSVQKQHGIVDTAQAWVDMFYKRSDQTPAKYRNKSFPVESDVRWLVDESVHTIDWLLKLGMTFGRPYGFGVDVAERYHSISNDGYRGGAGVVKFLSEKAEDLGVDIRVETKAVKVLQEMGPGSRVIGIEIEGGRKIYAKAVILAAGGFMSDVNKYLPGLEVVVWSKQLSTSMLGEGIDMAVEAGGELWEDPWASGVDPEQALTVEGLPLIARTNEGIYVDSSGTRVGVEGGSSAVRGNYPTFAQLDGGKLFAIISDAHATPTQEQIDSGRVFKGSTIAELAANAGINPAKLASEIAAYNVIAGAIAALKASSAPDDAYNGVDPLDIEHANIIDKPSMIPHDNTRKTYTRIEGPAFYAVELLPNIALTFGGVKTKTGTTEVLDKNDLTRVIPGLYAAGENANRNFYDKVYMSGSSTTQAVATGKVAGRTAATYAAAD
ncbi:MAG: FAD-dependent oxidoreductase [Acidobacteria bacterium]|nr:FAD-dependent oxidoreductase [Acidobacteriota bacterium]